MIVTIPNFARDLAQQLALVLFTAIARTGL